MIFLCTAVLTSKSSTRDAEAGTGGWGGGCKFEASLGFLRRPSLKPTRWSCLFQPSHKESMGTNCLPSLATYLHSVYHIVTDIDISRLKAEVLKQKVGDRNWLQSQSDYRNKEPLVEGISLGLSCWEKISSGKEIPQFQQLVGPPTIGRTGSPVTDE